MAVAALVVIGVGLLLVLAGLWVSLSDRRRKIKAAASGPRDEALALARDIDAFVKLLQALEGKPLGFQLIAFGFVFVLVGGVLGGASGL